MVTAAAVETPPLAGSAPAAETSSMASPLPDTARNETAVPPPLSRQHGAAVASSRPRDALNNGIPGLLPTHATGGDAEAKIDRRFPRHYAFF
jgi:hypothetical protein